MILRTYQPEDIKEMAKLFYETVHTVNAKDYTPEQLNAWATGLVDTKAWNTSFLQHTSLVAEQDGMIVGFGDIDSKGYLDRLYVHKDWQRQGIGRALCQGLESACSAPKLTTFASITAKPFFEAMGYVAVKKHQAYRQGVMLINYLMEKHKS